MKVGDRVYYVLNKEDPGTIGEVGNDLWYRVNWDSGLLDRVWYKASELMLVGMCEICQKPLPADREFFCSSECGEAYIQSWE